MAFKKVNDKELLNSLMDTFRRVGYDGASLSQLSESTGLKKASLYHRFPGGKQEMAEKVLGNVNLWIQENLVDVLTSEDPPIERLDTALHNINRLYDGGKDACILRALSQGTGLNLFQKKIKENFEDWINGFKTLAEDFGVDPSDSWELAEDVIIKIQGSLILSVTLKKPKIFKRTLEHIRSIFTA